MIGRDSDLAVVEAKMQLMMLLLLRVLLLRGV